MTASTSARRPRIRFSELSAEGKLNALRIWQPDYFTGPDRNDPDLADYADLTLPAWQALVMTHWNNLTDGFMDDNSGRK